MVVEAKVCGLTRPEDAAAAVAAGADYLGVVFAGGPRVVTAGQAAAIVAAARGRLVLGVFGAQPVEEILRLRDAAGLGGAQLHGSYSARDAERLRLEGLRVWRVLRLEAEADLDALPAAADGGDALLIEPRVPGAEGGAGVALPLALAARARERLHGRLVLAGGLTPETVAGAVGLVRPDAVDVSSGVEILPGIKDVQRMTRFLEAVRGFSVVA
ncbi:MAG: phosphoribosylanthranilate isomerase [Deltaproteobacteria bacterium]